MSSRDNVASPPLYTDKRKGEERVQQKEGYGRPKTGWGHGTSHTHNHSKHNKFEISVLFVNLFVVYRSPRVSVY